HCKSIQQNPTNRPSSQREESTLHTQQGRCAGCVERPPQRHSFPPLSRSPILKRLMKAAATPSAVKMYVSHGLVPNSLSIPQPQTKPMPIAIGNIHPIEEASRT